LDFIWIFQIFFLSLQRKTIKNNKIMKIEETNFENCIDFSNAVLQMRCQIINACKDKGLEPPTDKQISDYIIGYGVNVKDFMADYEEGEGMFRNLAFKRFKDKVCAVNWAQVPTDEEIESFFNEHGNNFSLYMETINIGAMTDAERVTYLGTITRLSERKLVDLWNAFIEEGTAYGKDSHIYDREDIEKFDEEGKEKIKSVLGSEKRYFQWFYDEEMPHVAGNIKNIILGYWSDIFPRIMMYPSAYEFDVELWCDGDGSTYFSNVFFPNLATLLGYRVDGGNCKIEYLGKGKE